MAGWTWGSIHRARFIGLLGIMPDLTELFTGGEGPRGGDEQTVNQAAFEPGAGYDVAVVASWRSDRLAYRQFIVQPASLAIALAGLYWTIQRIVG